MLSRLESIHEKGILHRDIKPENFRLRKVAKPTKLNKLEDSRKEHFPDEQKQEVYMIDFGLAITYKKDSIR